jgi:hypothetical protein
MFPGVNLGATSVPSALVSTPDAVLEKDWARDLPTAGSIDLASKVPGGSTIDSDAAGAEQTWLDFAKTQVRPQASAPLTIEQRASPPDVGSITAFHIAPGGLAISFGAPGNLPANLLAAAHAARVDHVVGYRSTAGTPALPFKPQFYMHTGMTGRDERSLATASSEYYAGVTPDNVTQQLINPWLGQASKKSNYTSMFHALARFKQNILAAEANNWEGNWAAPGAANTTSAGIIPVDYINLRAGIVGAPQLANLGTGQRVQLNTIGWTDRERRLAVNAVLGFIGIYHDGNLGDEGAVCQQFISHGTEMNPSVQRIVLFTDGTAGALGHWQGGPPSYEEIDAFMKKLACVRPCKKAFDTGKEMAVGSGYVIHQTSTQGVDMGEIADVPSGVAPADHGHFTQVEAIMSGAGGMRHRIYLPMIYTPQEYFWEMTTPGRITDYTNLAKEAMDGEAAQAMGKPTADTDTEMNKDEIQTQWLSIAHLFGFIDVMDKGVWFINQSLHAEVTAYSLGTTFGDKGWTGRFLNNQLLANSTMPGLARLQALDVDTQHGAPLDGWATARRQMYGKYFGMKVPKFAVAMTRLATEIDGDSGFVRWCRHTRPFGTREGTALSRVAFCAKAVPWWQVTQGLGPGGHAPESVDVNEYIAALSVGNTGLDLVPPVEVTKASEKEEGKAGKAKLELGLPYYNKEAAAFLWSKALEIAQASREHWLLFVPLGRNTNASLNQILALPANAVQFAVHPPVHYYADTVDTLSILPYQRWATTSIVGLGQEIGFTDNATKMRTQQALTSTLTFGRAGVSMANTA